MEGQGRPGPGHRRFLRGDPDHPGRRRALSGPAVRRSTEKKEFTRASPIWTRSFEKAPCDWQAHYSRAITQADPWAFSTRRSRIWIALIMAESDGLRGLLRSRQVLARRRRNLTRRLPISPRRSFSTRNTPASYAVAATPGVVREISTGRLSITPKRSVREPDDAGVTVPKSNLAIDWFTGRKTTRKPSPIAREALKLDPKLPDALGQRGPGLAEEEGIRQGDCRFHRGGQARPKGNRNWLMYRAVAYRNNKEFTRALADFAEALRLDAKSSLRPRPQRLDLVDLSRCPVFATARRPWPPQLGLASSGTGKSPSPWAVWHPPARKPETSRRP